MYELKHNGISVKVFQSKEEALQYIPTNRIETLDFGEVTNIYTAEDLMHNLPASYQLFKINP